MMVLPDGFWLLHEACFSAIGEKADLPALPIASERGSSVIIKIGLCHDTQSVVFPHAREMNDETNEERATRANNGSAHVMGLQHHTI